MLTKKIEPACTLYLCFVFLVLKQHYVPYKINKHRTKSTCSTQYCNIAKFFYKVKLFNLIQNKLKKQRNKMIYIVQICV